MAFVKGAYAELLKPLMGHKTGMSEMQMGQTDYYKLLQQQQGLSQQQLANQGLLGQLGGLFANQNLHAGQLVSGNDFYPGKVIQHQDLNAFDYRTQQVKPIAKIAEEFGFEYDFDAGGWKSKYDGFVSRMDTEGVRLEDVKKVFKQKKCPNQHWLDTRVEEMRVRLI